MPKPNAPIAEKPQSSAMPRRAPVSGTMARVLPVLTETTELPSQSASEEYPESYGLEEATRISSPLRILHASDEESTGVYEDLPTRIMHPPEEVLDAPASSRRRPSPEGPPVIAVAPQSGETILSTVSAPLASVVVAEERNEPRPAPADPLGIDRALLRALTATAPRLVMPPVVAIRRAPPSLRMLAIVAGFTTLGLMWVMAVCAMILVLVTR